MMNEPERIFRLLDQAIEAGREAALVTIISSAGSTPRDAGSRMVVFPGGGIAGTVGGGRLEALCIKSALAALKLGENRRESFDLTPGGAGMLCSGRAEVYIEVFSAKIKLLILGAGHVALKIARAAGCAAIPYSVADERADFASRERFPEAAEIVVARPHKAITPARVDGRTYIVIVTRGHAFDAQCLLRALPTKAAYIGMIGSASKVREVFAGFNRKGLHPERDNRVFSPIGLDISGKTPGEIAISVLAEILKIANGRTGAHMRVREARPAGKRPVKR
ncbi:MAG: XdhC/CoxI family protein [Elusimicrobiales bacterium]